MKHYSKISSSHLWIVLNYLLSYKHQQERENEQQRMDVVKRKKKARGSLNRPQDCIRTRKASADGKAPTERVAETAEEGKYHEYTEINFC